MSIRPMQQADLDAVMDLWLEANLQAHAFIPAAYWHRHAPQVRVLLPQAQVWVYERAAHICGLIGVQQDYVAGLFVARPQRSKGIGHQLLHTVKAQHERLALSVYQRNEGAVRFYRREGFVTVDVQMDPDTGACECHMAWRR